MHEKARKWKENYRPRNFVIASEGKKRAKLFIFLELFITAWREKFPSDLLALHEMHIVIKFRGGGRAWELHFTLKGKKFSSRKENYHKLTT